MNIADGSRYAPAANATTRQAVVAPGEFRFAAAYLDHGHIYGQTSGLLDAGGTLVAVFDPQPERASAFAEMYPQARIVRAFDELLDDPSLHMIAAAAVPSERAGIGERVLRSGKDYFTDKCPFTSLQQLEQVRATVAETGRRYMVYYSERLHNEGAWHAGELVRSGVIGDVVHMLIMAPHRLSDATRPDWFFEKARYGGIITDLGSHQVEQFLTYTGSADATVRFASVANVAHPTYPELEDFAEFSLAASDGVATFYARLDWLTPDGMPVWGDGRTFVVGTRGTMEVRKYIDPGQRVPASSIILADGSTMRVIDCQDKVGFPFFGLLIRDSLDRTEVAMTQEHVFKVAEISLMAQNEAERVAGL